MIRKLDKCHEYITDDGSIFLFGLINDDDISVVRAIFMNKATFPDHCHVGDEVLHAITGSFEITGFHDGSKIITKGNHVTVEKGLMHTVKALENNSTVLVVCMPPDKDWPREM